MKTCPKPLFNTLLIVLQRGRREKEKIGENQNMISVSIHQKEPKYLS
jgi:hypothetical protein